MIVNTETEYENYVNANIAKAQFIADFAFSDVRASIVEMRKTLDPNRQNREPIPITCLARNENPSPPSSREQPIDHFARILATGLLIEWCKSEGIPAGRRTVPPITREQKPHQFLFEEIYVDIYL